MNEVIQIATIVSTITGPISAIAAAVFLYDRFYKPEIRDRFFLAILEFSRRPEIRLIARMAFISFVTAVGILIAVHFTDIGIRINMPGLPTPQATTLGSSLPTQSVTPVPTATPIPTPTPEPMQSYTTVYTVRAGDTLKNIANRFNVTQGDVMGVNIDDPDNLTAGQVLLIPSYLGESPENRKPPTIPSTGTVNSVDGLNVRDTPSTTGTVQNIAPFETTLTLTGTNIIVNGIEWLELAESNWVQARYLDIIVRATVIPINGIGVVIYTNRPQIAYTAPHASVLELFRPSPVKDINTWWQVIDGNWVQGRYLFFS